MLAWWGNSVSGTPARTASSGNMVAGSTYYRECRYVDDGTIASSQRFIYQPPRATPAAAAPPAPVPRGPSIEEIVRQVYAEVPLVLPQPHTAPPVDADQLVGFPVWMWVDGEVWRDFEAHAAVAGVSVSVVAHPKQVAWTMGDGATVVCRGPGTAWDPADPHQQRTDCSHIYQFVSAGKPSGRYQATVTVTWSISWSASTGQSGVLPDASRTTAFSLHVVERQAVIHYGS
jgi:hypothetical protein